MAGQITTNCLDPRGCCCRKVRTKRTKRTKSSVWVASTPKRDDLSAYELSMANVPSSGVRAIRPGIASGCVRRCGVSKLSKLLNQEDALSVPCLRGDLRTGVILHFDVTLSFGITEPSCWQALMLFPVVGGRCTGRSNRCKAKQGRRGKTALKFVAYYHSNTVFWTCREVKRIYLVTMAVRCFFAA
jgi:hypothetical protein